MPDLLSFLIQNCLHDPRGDAKIDISSKELEENFEPAQVTYLKGQGLLERRRLLLFEMFLLRPLLHGRCY